MLGFKATSVVPGGCIGKVASPRATKHLSRPVPRPKYLLPRRQTMRYTCGDARTENARARTHVCTRELLFRRLDAKAARDTSIFNVHARYFSWRNDLAASTGMKLRIHTAIRELIWDQARDSKYVFTVEINERPRLLFVPDVKFYWYARASDLSQLKSSAKQISTVHSRAARK